jgi:hypothetical protein
MIAALTRTEPGLSISQVFFSNDCELSIVKWQLALQVLDRSTRLTNPFRFIRSVANDFSDAAWYERKYGIRLLQSMIKKVQMQGGAPQGFTPALVFRL